MKKPFLFSFLTGTTLLFTSLLTSSPSTASAPEKAPEGELVGVCKSIEGSPYQLSFAMIQTDYDQQTYLFKGTRKGGLFGKANFKLNSQFLRVYENQFYTFRFVAPFIKDSVNLMIKTEMNENKTSSGFIVDHEGFIQDELLCLDLS